MPDVLFDPQFTARSSQTAGYIGASGPFNRTAQRAFAIYKAGTLPADLSELIVYGNVPGVFTPDTNLLLHLASWNGVTISVTSGITVGNYGLIQVTTSAALALESGTAAEFLYYNTVGFSENSDLQGVVAGTVTAAGGGGDLVINNVNLVQGSSYSVVQWRHKVFQDFSYV